VDTVTIAQDRDGGRHGGDGGQVVLGPITGSKEGQLSQRDFALAHQNSSATRPRLATYTGFLVLLLRDRCPTT